MPGQKKPPRQDAASTRKERLKAALRANLQKRKSQARARSACAGGGQVGTAESPGRDPAVR